MKLKKRYYRRSTKAKVVVQKPRFGYLTKSRSLVTWKRKYIGIVVEDEAR
jgi:hypothetical protein